MSKQCEGGHDLENKVKCSVCGNPLFVPNWFDKEDLEMFVGKKIPQSKMIDFIEDCGGEIADEVSGIVADAIGRYLKGGQ